MNLIQKMQQAGEFEMRRDAARQAAAPSKVLKGLAYVTIENQDQDPPLEVVMLGVCNAEGEHGYRLARGFNGLAGYAPLSRISGPASHE